MVALLVGFGGVGGGVWSCLVVGLVVLVVILVVVGHDFFATSFPLFFKYSCHILEIHSFQ